MATRRLKQILLVLTVIVFVTTISFFEKTQQPPQNKQKRWAIEETPAPSRDFLKIFHLDLKGAPPKLSFLFEVLPLVRKYGADAILIEYEDMFPFNGRLKNVSAGNCYSMEEVKELVALAESLKMEVIPLVQTFGHLEYLLKLEEFRGLRELESFPQEICPSKKEAVWVVKLGKSSRYTFQHEVGIQVQGFCITSNELLYKTAVSEADNRFLGTNLSGRIITTNKVNLVDGFGRNVEGSPTTPGIICRDNGELCVGTLPESPDDECSQLNSEEMIRQVMALHPRSRYIHVGCDEVRHLGACHRCATLHPKKVFAKHVRKIADYIITEYPGVTPLIWDDMLRRWTFDDLNESDLGSTVQPVVWVYGSNIFNLVPRFAWNIYQRVFPKIWVASAFKGAFGETEILPDLGRHLENHLSWMNVLDGRYEDVDKKPEAISGVFLTGWSRYDHFAVLCELLPVGIPSLILNLVFLNPVYHHDPISGFRKWFGALNCPDSFHRSDLLTIRKEELFRFKLGNCSFPGSDLYLSIVQFQDLRTRVKSMVKKIETSGWVSRYNLQRNFTSPWRVIEMFPGEGFAGEYLRREVSEWKSSFRVVMNRYFDKYTIDEWEEQYVHPIEEKLKEIQSNFQKLIQRNAWPRRPLA